MMTPEERGEQIARLVADVHGAIRGQQLQYALMALLINVQAIFEVCDDHEPPVEARRAYGPLKAEIELFLRAGRATLLKPLVN